MAGKILIIVHQATSTPGRVGVKLRARGYDLDVRRLVLGHDLPETLAGYKGAIVFGGPQSANDDDDIIHREIDWMAVPLKEQVPYFGICLGAQLMARHLGAPVSFHPDCCAEIGYYPIAPTERGAEIARWPRKVYQWHREGFELPGGAELLATGGNAFPCQAYRYGKNAYNIQFHPEVTLAMTHRWTVKAAHRFSLPGVRPAETHFRDRMVFDPEVDRWLDEFLDFWLAA